MKINNFSYRYNVSVNGRTNGQTWFTTRDEARAYRRELAASGLTDLSIVRQKATWGDSMSVT